MGTSRKRVSAILVVHVRGRGKKVKKKILRGSVAMDIDGDRKKDRITFWLRTGKGRNNKKGTKGSGYAANVSLTSQKKRRKKKVKRRK